MKRIFKFIATLPIILLTGCEDHIDNNIERYSELREKFIKESDFHTELYIFPETIEKSKVIKFKTQYREFIFTGSYLFHLVYQFGDDFDSEIQRLASIKADFKNGKSKTVIHFKENSLFLTINRDDRYEFAKYDVQTKQITYTSNQLYLWKDIHVDSLESINIPKSQDDGKNSYNMYYFYEGDIGYYVNDDFHQ